mgnify:CR=1 FL=1
MSTHEFTAADCTWADLHFSDLGEAREHLDALIEARKTLQSMRRLKAFAKSDVPDADIVRIDQGIAELESREEELAALVVECSMDALFD